LEIPHAKDFDMVVSRFISLRREAKTPLDTATPVEQRIAHALEHIAAKLDEISEKLDRLKA
jgi:CRP-like cAMP-binding protein